MLPEPDICLQSYFCSLDLIWALTLELSTSFLDPRIFILLFEESFYDLILEATYISAGANYNFVGLFFLETSFPGESATASIDYRA